MEPQTETPIVDAFDAAITAESNYVEPKTASTDATLDDTAQTVRDDKGRFAPTKPAEAKADEAETVEAKVAKPRNDPQARIDQAIARQRETERENARLKADLDAARRNATVSQPAAPAAPVTPERFPRFDEWSTAHPDKGHDDYLDARDEWRDTRRETQARAQQEHAQREQAFATRAAGFSDRYAAAREADPDIANRIDQKLLTAKPFSTLTPEDRALISKIPDARQREEFAFLCFLADQWIDSDHAVALLEHVSDPKEFQRLATLPPNQVIRELARFEAGLAAASDKESRGSVAKPSASQAHPPFKPLGSAPRTPEADDGAEDEPIESFIRRENVKDRKSGRLG